MEKDKVYLNHIFDAITLIESFTKGQTKSSFIDNELLISAVVRQLEIIGEAAKKTSAGFKAKHKDVLWKEITGMRNILIHEYFNVDLKLVWETVRLNLPKFKKQIAVLLKTF